MRNIAVIDIGKTNAKVLLVDLGSGAEVVALKRQNSPKSGPPYPHFDVEGLWDFLRDGLRRIAAAHPVDAISVTTHGACAALVDADGALALPILDYEHPGPDSVARDYAAVRPDFAETGAPRLPCGLNLGAQIFWQSQSFPEAFARVRLVLTYPQYWSFRLTGVAASEPTSLGCHTDLWDPWRGDFSGLVDRMGWRGLFPPLRPASAVLGGLLPAIAAETGLAAATPVISGIHDSNASLVPWLDLPRPFAVTSTGTWMITMAMGAGRIALDAGRDTLVNVNARGEPVPTARYMAGREFDEITAGAIAMPTEASLRGVLRRQVMALPSRHPETGPFPGLGFGWFGAEPLDDAERCAAASAYAALMGAECLDLIGAGGPVVVEGPFGGNGVFLRMLATATGRPVTGAGQSAGTGLGAALLAGPLLVARPAIDPVLPETDPLWTGYAAAWRAEVRRRWDGRGTG